VALDELRIECNFPANEGTAAVFRERFWRLKPYAMSFDPDTNRRGAAHA
jgi:hypothetical protein